jgi:hypothetical protein
MEEINKSGKLRIVDNPDVTEFYINKFLGSFFDGGAVTLTFGNIRLLSEKTDEGPTPGQQPHIHVTHRLSLSPSAAVELINGLNTVLNAMTQAKAQNTQAN